LGIGPHSSFQRRTEPWPQLTCTEKFHELWTRGFCDMRVDRHTDTLIASGVTRIWCKEAQNYMKLLVTQNDAKLECGPMPNVMVALSNTGGALC